MIVALQRSYDLTADLHPHGSFWWLLPDSNWGHAALQAAALPTELKSLAGVKAFAFARCVLTNNFIYFTRGDAI